jgi:hypothetical protein
MARADKISITSTAQEIANGDYGSAAAPASVLVKNPTGGNTVYLGGATVDATDGFPLAGGESVAMDLVAEGLWAMCASTQDINVLYLRG